VRLAGDVSVGRAAWVGIGSVVLEKRSIAAGAIVGAGSLVTQNVPSRVLAYGSPARVVREVETSDEKIV
jgi:acetyltransferase-like isoleucine patch superfamily enzyme